MKSIRPLTSLSGLKFLLLTLPSLSAFTLSVFLVGLERLRLHAMPHGEGNPLTVTRRSKARQALPLVTVLSGIVFLVSAAFNLGVSFTFGSSVVGFSSPSASIASYELAIGAVLLASAALSNLYLYGGAYLFASVGIAEGLLSPAVQGLARSLHEVMVPLAAIGWALVLVETRVVSRTRPKTTNRTHEIIAAMQFFVGALVTLGGAAYARFGTYPVGTAVGLVHLSVGLAGLFGGYVFLRNLPWSRTFLMAINGITIGYSAFSESLAELYALMSPGINDSLIGTIIAIMVSTAIIYSLRGSSREDG